MNTWIRRSLQVSLISAGFVLVAGAAAQAGVHSGDNDGILNGTQVIAPVQLPANVCGNAVGVLAKATAGCEGGATARHTTSGGGVTSRDNDGILNGTQILAPIQAPIDISGNAVGVLGQATAGSVGGATAETKSAGATGPAAVPHLSSIDNDGILNGTQILAPIQAPINVCGNAVGVVADATAGCVGGATARYTTGVVGGPGTGLMSGDGVVSRDNDGIGNGTQVVAPIQVPVNVCGNAVGALFADATAGCENGALAKFGPHTPTAAELAKARNTTSARKTMSARNTMSTGPGGGTTPTGGVVTEDNDGILNGTQVLAPIQVPINVCGNAVGVLANATAGCAGGSTAQIK